MLFDPFGRFSTFRNILLEILLGETPVKVATPVPTTPPPEVDIAPGQWTAWPEWVTSPYEVAGDPPGEKRVAEMLGGQQTRSKSIPFDVNVESGPYAGQWEVKAPDASSTIRCGTDSVAATEDMRVEALRVAKFIKSIENDPVVLGDAAARAAVGAFLKDGRMGYDSALRGNVSRSALSKMESALVAVKTAAERAGGSVGSSVTLGISTPEGDSSRDVSYTTALRVAKLAGLDVPGLAPGSGGELMARLEEVTSFPVETWAAEVVRLVDVQKCFHSSDKGVFLVRPTEFLLVPVGEIKDKFVFARTSNGRAHLKFIETKAAG